MVSANTAPSGLNFQCQRTMAMTTKYIYPAKGGAPVYYIDGNDIYPTKGGGAEYWINGDYIYPSKGGAAAYWINGEYIYPASGGAGAALFYIA